jgi:hypothetical protein
MSINIAGKDKVALLKALWNAAWHQEWWIDNGSFIPFDNSEAIRAVTSYIDYFCGRLIKTDISGDTADPRFYDLEFRPGAFQRVVDSM